MNNFDKSILKKIELMDCFGKSDETIKSWLKHNNLDMGYFHYFDKMRGNNK